MTDYASMTNEQLNRLVAERLGWTDFKEGQYFLESWGNYDFVDCTFGTPPDGKSQPIDEPASDLNAAAALDFEGAVLEISIDDGRRGDERVKVTLVNVQPIIRAYATTEPRARTIAWLMYTDAVGEAKP